MAPSDDPRLLAAAAAGDRPAMDELVRRHAPLVLAACRRQLPAAEADDAAQAVFLVLWRRAGAAAAAPGLPGWLVVTARQVCANAHRALARRRAAERAASPAPATEAPPNEARALLDQALADLPASEREAVVRRHLLGEDPAAVATALGCAEGTVHSRTSRGLERLRAWFARRGIACSTAALAGLCADECLAAEAVTPAATMACATPSTAARTLAAAATAFPILVFGASFMAIAAIALVAFLFVPTAVTPGAETPPTPTSPLQQTSRMYDIRNICQPEVVIASDLPVREIGRPVMATSSPPPPPDATLVSALDSCRSLRRLCELIHSRTGSSSTIRLVDIGMTDEDLLEAMALGTAELAVQNSSLRELRRALSWSSDVPFPGLDVARTMLVTADPTGHDCIEADLPTLRLLRQQRLASDPVLTLVGKALLEATNRAFAGAWHTIDDSPPGAAPAALPTALAGTATRRFAIIWLPENLHSSQAIAVATDGRCCLIAQPGRGIVWRPDARPAAVALYLRQRLDRQLIRAPLRDVHWRNAAGCAVVVEDLQAKSYNIESRQLYLDLAELVRNARAEPGQPAGF